MFPPAVVLLGYTPKSNPVTEALLTVTLYEEGVDDNDQPAEGKYEMS